jgi:acylphosphatase
VLVSGRVQGVGYRAAARDRANQLGLDGFARNLWDGRVEIVAEGPADRVDTFLAWNETGPIGARVTSLTVEDEAPTDETTGFRIARG